MEYSLLLCFLFLFTVNCEPECSRFHYEQMTLEKMIRQELNVEKELGEYRDELQRMKNEINDLRSETETCKIELERVKETKEKMRDEHNEKFQQMEKEIFELKNETKNYKTALNEVRDVKQTAREVIFHAKTLKNKSPSSGERFVFTHVMSNVGSGYSTSDGRFTAPVNGTYAFTVQLCVDIGAGYKQYGIIKSTGEALVRSQLGNPGDSYWDCDALSIYEFLKVGESVWVEHKTGSRLYKDVSDQLWNYFSGVLLK